MLRNCDFNPVLEDKRSALISTLKATVPVALALKIAVES